MRRNGWQLGGVWVDEAVLDEFEDPEAQSGLGEPERSREGEGPEAALMFAAVRASAEEADDEGYAGSDGEGFHRFAADRIAQSPDRVEFFQDAGASGVDPDPGGGEAGAQFPFLLLLCWSLIHARSFSSSAREAS